MCGGCLSEAGDVWQQEAGRGGRQFGVGDIKQGVCWGVVLAGLGVVTGTNVYTAWHVVNVLALLPREIRGADEAPNEWWMMKMRRLWHSSPY